MRVVLLRGPQHRRHRHPRRPAGPGPASRLGTDVVVVTHPSTAQRFGWDDARTVVAGPVCRRRRPACADLRRLRRLAAGADVLHAHGHQAGLLATLLSLTATRPAVVVSQHNMVLPGSGLGRVKTVGAAVASPGAPTWSPAPVSDLVEQARALGAADARLAAVPSPKVPALLAADVLDDRGPGTAAGAAARPGRGRPSPWS